MVYVENDSLILKYSAKYNTAGGGDLRRKGQPKGTVKLRLPINSQEWSDVLISFNRKEKVQIYVNGELAAERIMNSEESDVSLNSIFNLNLFSDTFGKNKMMGEIDDVRIWQKAITPMDNKKITNNHLVLYHSFNAAELTSLKEHFTNENQSVTGNITTAVKSL